MSKKSNVITKQDSNKALVINRLKAAGITIHNGKKTPKNGRYSAVVGSLEEERVLKI
ncbi:hypothetical protein [Salirhabdus sp. Marseille-P4669]|uniref:hypothetical protein n=1 Tax=Salirhabdus sp. Marseille-P4669 TaxID=2042310 RepID=UPI00135840EB|nr:hypothetical protein [Salirhabdus sp. Marseille-P4669]